MGRAGGLNPQKQALKALGAYRLLKNRTAFQVGDFLRRTGSHYLPTQETALYRLRKQADREIAAFTREMLQSLVKGGYVDLVVQCGRLMQSSTKAIAAAKEGKISLEELDRIRESIIPGYPRD